jgi:hypothetical protein
MDKPKRKRIIKQDDKNNITMETPFDDKAYIPNSATENAKKIHVFDETLI